MEEEFLKLTRNSHPVRKYVEKSCLALLNILFRSLSFVDLVTDIRLLYLASKSKLIAWTISLFLTIVLPYILSYSVGIRIHFIHGTNTNKNKNKNDEILGFQYLFSYLLIMPFGIIYYVFLDFLDLIFSYYKGFRIIIMQDSEQRLILLQEILSKQCGIGNRMNYEGIKRQKSIAQLLFESIPQLIIQTFAVFDIGLFRLDNNTNETISEFDIYLSMTFALLNAIGQLWRIILEKKSIEESFIQYCVTCLTGRIGWIPFKYKIENILKNNKIENENENENEIPLINYKIQYEYPFGISKFFRKKGEIIFDFSQVTIKEFLNNIDTTTLHESHKDSDIVLNIDFDNSLRLLSFQDLSQLFKVCILYILALYH